MMVCDKSVLDYHNRSKGITWAAGISVSGEVYNIVRISTVKFSSFFTESPVMKQHRINPFILYFVK